MMNKRKHKVTIRRERWVSGGFGITMWVARENSHQARGPLVAYDRSWAHLIGKVIPLIDGREWSGES